MGNDFHAQLHGMHGQGHHHLAMVVVEMGLVLERMTDDKYGSSGTSEGELFKEIWIEQVSKEVGEEFLRA